MATAQTLQVLQQKIQGLSDEQIRLIEEFADLLRMPKSKEEARATLKHLFGQRARTMSPLSEAETERLALEAVTWARGQL